MEKVLLISLAPQAERKVMRTLTYEGKIAAIREYKQLAGCRLREAKQAVDRLSREIEPGQAQ